MKLFLRKKEKEKKILFSKRAPSRRTFWKEDVSYLHSLVQLPLVTYIA